MRRSLTLILAATILADLACGSKVNPGTDGSTHFWITCATDAECDGAGECICGHCTTECTRDAECTQPASRCEVASSRLDCAVDESICIPDEPQPTNQRDASVESTDASVDTISGSLDDSDASVEDTSGLATTGNQPGTSTVLPDPTADTSNANASDAGLTACLDTPGCPWTSLPDAPFLSSLTAVHDSKFFAFAGGYSVTIFDAGPSSLSGPPTEWRDGNFVYDITTEQWSTLATPPASLWASSAAVIGNRAYLPNRDGQMFIYDIDTDTWSNGTEAPDSLTAASSHAVGDLLYLFGGYHAGPEGDSVSDNSDRNLQTYVYTPESDAWHTVADAPSPAGGTSCVWNGRLFVFGGPNNDDPSLSGITQIYDTTLDTWSTGATRPNVDYQQYCVTLGDGLYIFGGNDLDASGSDMITRYSPSVNTWDEVSFPPGLITSAPQVMNGAVYVVGSYRDSEETRAQFWRFAPSP